MAAPRREESILVDFKQAKDLILKAAEDYINLYSTSQDKPSGERYGTYHGQSGINRARNLIICLKQIEDDNKLAILAMLSVIYDKPKFLGISIGRSSALASMIADSFISGQKVSIGALNYARNTDTLSSVIFSKTALQKIKNDHRADDTRAAAGQGIVTTFNKTVAVRIFIQEILNSPEFAKDKINIESLSKKIKSVITSSDPQIETKAFNDLKDQFKEFKQSVSAQAFESATPRLPKDIGKLLSKFSTLQDTANLARVNRSTRDAAQKYAPTKQKKK